MANHQDIVKHLLNSKAVDFAAIGKAVTELGPNIAVADEPWEGICGTMRRFIIVYRINDPGAPVENLGQLGSAAPQLR
jgi:hypothetical protein